MNAKTDSKNLKTLTDEEFSQEFYKKQKILDRIKLCIECERYRIWKRSKDRKANLPSLALRPILNLADGHQVKKAPRQSGGSGSYECYEMVYKATLYGRVVEIYFKGYFSKAENEDGKLLTINIEVQSVRDNKIR